MSSPSKPPSEADVLCAIGDLLSAKSRSAALAHYPTLRIQTNNLHAALTAAIGRSEVIIEKWSASLASDAEVASEFRAPGTVLFAYRTIAPALVRNLHRTADFLLEETRAAPPVDVDRVSETVPSFSAFVRLGSAVRGFLDALVQAAYQLATFDGLQLNYKFLQSLLSFATVAPPALHANIVSSEMQAALDAYVALTGKERKNSSFTKAACDQFAQRLSVSCDRAGLPDWRRHNLELLFSFCSDFVHSGHVSVLATAGSGSDLVMGGPADAFTAKAENFAELKHRLLAECAGAYGDLLMPVLQQAIGQTLVAGMPTDWADHLRVAATGIGDVRAILHRELLQPIRKGLIGSDALVRVDCMCGGHVDLRPPHHEWDRFCSKCGSRILLHEVGEEVDYVVSASGVGSVLGGDAPKVGALDPDARAKLDRIAAKHAPKEEKGEVAFLLITDLSECDEDTLRVPYRITSAPRDTEKKLCSLFTFVAAKSLARCAAIRIRCNCGTEVGYVTEKGTNVCRCPQCHTFIGLLGVSGDGEAISIRNPDGTPGEGPIQARHRFKEPGIGTD